MDRQEDNSVKASVSQDVHDAKARFLSASARVDILAPLRKHPWAVVLSSAALGAVAGSIESVLAAKSSHAPIKPDEPKEEQHVPPKTARGIVGLIQPMLVPAIKMAASWWAARQQAQTQTDPADLQNAGNFE